MVETLPEPDFVQNNAVTVSPEPAPEPPFSASVEAPESAPYIVNAALKEAVQKMLDRVDERKPTQSEAEDMVQRTIQTLMSFKRHLQDTYRAGGDEALKDLFGHHKVYIPVSKIKTWIA